MANWIRKVRPSDYMRSFDALTYSAPLSVDVAFGAGLLTFDEVCKKVERIALRDEDELKKIETEIEEMGGLAVYQKMSTIGQGKDRGGGSEDVFIKWLDELGIREEMQERKAKLR